MTEKQTTSKWTGMKGKIMAWFCNSPLRTLIEVRLLGLPRTAFLSEVSNSIHSNEVILDVGAGSGYFSLAIAKMLSTGKVICLDLSEEMLNRLERKAEKEGIKDKIQILKRGASSSGLKDESVDLVVSNFALHEFSSPETVLMEMIRVLKPNGRVIITDLLSNSWLGKMEVVSADAHGPYSVDELKAFFTKYGLKDVKVSSIKYWLIGMGKK